MHFQNSFAVRRLIRKAIIKAQPEETIKLLVLLRNRDNFDDLQQSLEAEYGSVELSGKFTDFLDWLLANADEIIALILKLLPLFV